MGRHFTEDARDYLEPLDRFKLAVISDELTATMKETIVSVIHDALQGLSDKIDAIKDVITEAVAKEAELSVERDEQKACADAAEAKASDLQGQLDAANSELSNAADEIKALGEKIDALTIPAAPVVEEPAPVEPAPETPAPVEEPPAETPVVEEPAPVEPAPVVEEPPAPTTPFDVNPLPAETPVPATEPSVEQPVTF